MVREARLFAKRPFILHQLLPAAALKKGTKEILNSSNLLRFGKIWIRANCGYTDAYASLPQ